MSARLKYSKTVNGQAMQRHAFAWRIVPQGTPGPRAGDRLLSHDDIPRLRRLLRTNKPIKEIAEQFCVSSDTLRQFIKRRQICNLKERRNFNTLQKSLARLGDGE